MEIRGVNLGNWLVLEKWMSPSLFEGTTAEDEYWLPRELSKEVYEERIRTHRKEYITERDFAKIRSWRMNAVRIPVPYFVFGDREPFIGCVEELDQAFAWAQHYEIKILLDLHTAPESQNGFDNGGLSGVCKWAQNPKEVEFELTVLERLAKRYGRRDELWGIEVINEPMLPKMWKIMDVPKRYPPKDEQMAAGSEPVPYDFLRQFYLDAYDRLRKYLPEEKCVVLHDGFELMIWKNFMREEKYKNVVLDTHKYLVTSEVKGCEPTVEGYEKYIQEHFAEEIREMQQYFPVICGEWCLSHGVKCAQEQKKEIYHRIGRAQLDAWKKGNGYFYWNYKLLLDTVNMPEFQGWESWDLDRCMDLGWFPQEERG